MGLPAARLSDMHVCPMVTPGTPPIPHVGGPITGPGIPTVLIGGLPAATMGDMCTCVGPPDSIIKGSIGVLIGGKPAARMSDNCAHGGMIVLGCPTVLIGDMMGGGGGGGSVMPVQIMLELMQVLPAQARNTLARTAERQQAAENGDPFIQGPGPCPTCGQEHHPEEAHPAGPAATPATPASGETPPEPAPTATITSQTVARSPSDRTRTKLGVGEEVRLTYSLGEASWEISGDGELSSASGSQVTFTAADHAGNITITATGGGTSAEISFEVIIPESWHMYKKSGTNVEHNVGHPDCGFQMIAYLHPNDVNFYRVEVRETDSRAVSTGSYNAGPFANQFHGNYPLPNQVSAWMPASNHTERYGTSIGGVDHVYSGYPAPAVVGTAPPFATGTKEYPIRWQWHVVSRPRVSDLPATRQRHVIAADGRCTTSKAGYSGSALFSDPTSI
jgi:uncharacterized Zn-binding protein involved in type VI secretion